MRHSTFHCSAQKAVTVFVGTGRLKVDMGTATKKRGPAHEAVTAVFVGTDKLTVVDIRIATKKIEPELANGHEQFSVRPNLVVSNALGAIPFLSANIRTLLAKSCASPAGPNSSMRFVPRSTKIVKTLHLVFSFPMTLKLREEQPCRVQQ